jgi:hypothetical protein
MEKLAENDLTYFYLRHVVIVVTAVTTINLPPVILDIDKTIQINYMENVIYDLKQQNHEFSCNMFSYPLCGSPV